MTELSEPSFHSAATQTQFQPNRRFGFRALAYIIDGDCRLVSRRNHVYKSLSVLCELIAADLRVQDAVLDGEVVCLGPDGHAQFTNLMYPFPFPNRETMAKEN